MIDAYRGDGHSPELDHFQYDPVLTEAAESTTRDNDIAFDLLQ